MTAPDDDVFALAGIAPTATPSHWTPIVRTQDFEAQQKATRARLAETYEPGQSERSMVHPVTFPGARLSSISVKWVADVSALADALTSAWTDIRELLKRDDVYTYVAQGIATVQPKPPKPNFDEMTPRARALALKNDRARTKGIEGTKKAIRQTQEPK